MGLFLSNLTYGRALVCYCRSAFGSVNRRTHACVKGESVRTVLNVFFGDMREILHCLDWKQRPQIYKVIYQDGGETQRIATVRISIKKQRETGHKDFKYIRLLRKTDDTWRSSNTKNNQKEHQTGNKDFRYIRFLRNMDERLGGVATVRLTKSNTRLETKTSYIRLFRKTEERLGEQQQSE